MNKKCLIYICCATFLALLLYFLNWSHLPVWYRSPALSGTVVDGRTGQPLAGVTVSVKWSAMRSTDNPHNPETTDIHFETAVTDASGVFTIPAWGPINLSGGWFYFSTDPEAAFSQSGHGLGSIHNRNDPNFDETTPFPLQTVTFEKPSWDGQKIPL